MISKDDMFEALAHVQRRRLLVDLLEGGPQRVPELSEATRELAGASEAFIRQYLSDHSDIDGVDDDLLRLYYVHLPMLAEYGFVEWSTESRLATRGPRFDELLPVLELLAYRAEPDASGGVPEIRR